MGHRIKWRVSQIADRTHRATITHQAENLNPEPSSEFPMHTRGQRVHLLPTGAGINFRPPRCAEIKFTQEKERGGGLPAWSWRMMRFPRALWAASFCGDQIGTEETSVGIDLTFKGIDQTCVELANDAVPARALGREAARPQREVRGVCQPYLPENTTFVHRFCTTTVQLDNS